MRVADVLLGLGRHEATRVFRRYVRDTRHRSASPRLRGEDCLPRRSTAKAGGEGACSIRDARFNARSVCKVTSAFGIEKPPAELSPPKAFGVGYLGVIGFLGRCPRFATANGAAGMRAT